jgi:hypothetical protein
LAKCCILLPRSVAVLMASLRIGWIGWAYNHGQ